MGVPNLPGVPALPLSVIEPFEIPTQVVDPVGFFAIPPPVWGVFDEAFNPVAVSDTFLGMAFKTETRVPDFQIEDGGFASYNKVDRPYRCFVRLGCGGDDQTRQAFLQAIDGAKRSLDLYTIITPDAVYNNANITAYDYRRELHEGVGILLVTLQIEEIRIVSAVYTQVAREPSGASAANGGKVQPVPPTPPQSSVLNDGLGKIKEGFGFLEKKIMP